MTYQPADRRRKNRQAQGERMIQRSLISAGLLYGCLFGVPALAETFDRAALFNEINAIQPIARDSDDQPTVADADEEIAIQVADRFTLGDIVEANVTLPEGVDLVGVAWETPLKYRPKPGPGHAIYLWPTGDGVFPIKAVLRVKSGSVELKIATSDEIHVGPPEPPKTLRELAGTDAGALAKVYATLSKGQFTSLTHFHNVEAVGLGNLQRSPAVTAIADRLKAIAPFDAAKLTAELAAIAKELGAEPEPPVPPTPPVVVGKRYVVVLSETENHTPAVGLLINALRTGDTAAYLKSKGHVLDILDDDNPAPIVAKLAALGVQEPALFVLDPTTGAVLHSQPLPATAAEVLTILKAHGG